LGAGSLTKVSNAFMDFKDRTSLTNSTVQTIINSLEVNNETPLVGNVTNPDSSELKRRVYDTFPTQDRAVTQADYENVVYRMPAKFGSIKRVSVQRDPDSMKRNLNMYVISTDSFGKLTETNSTIKDNIKTWINQYRMINDTVDILDPFIINLGVEFQVKAKINVNKFTLLEACITALGNNFGDLSYIGEAFYVSDIFSVLKDVEGVLDVITVKLINKTGGQYASTVFDINGNMSPDGTYLVAPKNCIFEIKFPAIDIKGKVK
jgi:hypothetical protein